MKLESRLQTLLGDSTSGYDWAILERLTPLLHLWVSNQLSMLDRWHERLWESESWKPISEGGKGCSRFADISISMPFKRSILPHLLHPLSSSKCLSSHFMMSPFWPSPLASQQDNGRFLSALLVSRMVLHLGDGS